MAIATNALPYGLRDVKLAPLDAADNPLTKVDLTASQTFSFSETEEVTELRGDDVLIAVKGKGAKVEWTLENGGISLQAYVVMSGGTYSLSGSTPNQVKKVAKSGTDSRPYFYAEGQAISDSGGDWHAKVFKCKVTDALEGDMKDGEFWITKASGQGLPNLSNQLYELTQNETAVTIT